ncbi:MAG: hypothetical protein A2341_19315 [Deltaproteobacteria bacterium RIFOXYB12_FULL_58_9]|nr:MAG: hypothetical protein A2341_19315 [Deltaproteobacteria bacterium RIFOXYB12_FULL_58_9]
MLWRMGYPDNYPGIKQGVRLISETTGPEEVQVTAVVDRVDEDGRLELSCLNAAKAVHLRKDLAVILEYFREGAIYKMHTAVVDVGPESDVKDPKARRQVIVGPSRELQKIQRRRFSRVFTAIRVSFIKVDTLDIDLTSRKGQKQAAKWAKEMELSGREGSTETLSGSGLRMRTDPDVTTGDYLYMQIELPSATVEAVGEVVWMGSRPPKEVPGEAVGVDFKSWSDETRLTILEFVEGQKRP